MTRLEDLKPNATIRGLVLDGNAIVLGVQRFGPEALEQTLARRIGTRGVRHR